MSKALTKSRGVRREDLSSDERREEIVGPNHRRRTMPMNQALLSEFDHEMANTRKTLERVPDAAWDWKPHQKSGTMGWLANHIALFPGWLAGTFESESLDIAPGGKQIEQPTAHNRQELLAIFDKGTSD